MKTIAVSDEVHAALQRLSARLHRDPDDVLASLLSVPAVSPEAAEPIAGFVLSSGFRALTTEWDKYLALLSWIAAHHAAEFSEFIRSQSVGPRYLSMGEDEILAICRRNHARQIDGTQYWAIMNIDLETKRRFLGRVLDFIGYRVEVIEVVCSTLGAPSPRRRQFAALVA